MAYDPLNPKDDEAPGAESQYASLMAPSAAPAAPAATGSAAGPAPAAATPAAAPKAPSSSRPGFVNFDRVMNANKNTVDRMRDTAQSTENQQAQALRSQAQSIQKDVEAKAKSSALPAAPTAPVTAEDALMNGVDVKANASATYGGPVKSDVESRYAPLLASYHAFQNSQVAPTGLDGRLLDAAGGIDTSGRKGAENAFNASLGKATGMANDASAAFADNKSKWGALLGQHETENTATAAKNADKSYEDARTAEAQKTFKELSANSMRAMVGNEVANKYQAASSILNPDQLRELNRIAANGDRVRFSVEFDRMFREAGGNPNYFTPGMFVGEQSMREP